MTSTSPTATTTLRDRGATNAFAIAVVSLVLIWPFGVVLGPAALFLGISALRRISGSETRLRGQGFAIAAIAIAAVVSGLCAVIVMAEIVVLVLTGSLIPAP